MSQDMDIPHATKLNSSKSVSLTRSTQPTIKQAYNIYEPLHEDSSTDDDNIKDTETGEDRTDNYIEPALELILSSLPRPLRIDAFPGHRLDHAAKIKETRLP